MTASDGCDLFDATSVLVRGSTCSSETCREKIPAASVTLKLACDVSVSDGERSDADGREASLTKEGAKIRETPKKRKES